MPALCTLNADRCNSARSQHRGGLGVVVQVGTLKDTLGFNLAAMRHLSRTSLTANAVMGDDGDTARQPSKRLREATPA